MKARDIGIPFSGRTGLNNAITDVKGLEVGYATIIEGIGKLNIGIGPIRTGVTIILPRGKKEFSNHDPCYANWYSFNGNGEMTGTTWVEESGLLEGPIAITNTHSIGTVHDAIIKYYILKKLNIDWLLPVVAETYDGFLNDINGFHVKEEHVFKAIESATSGQIQEGNVGGGTGMICHGFKGGTGTSSRIVSIDSVDYTIGVLVQANYGDRKYLTIRGKPIGELILGYNIVNAPLKKSVTKESSIIVVVGTDAPLLPHQLKKLAKRVPLGIGRVGGYGANSSGDLFISFSTANSITSDPVLSLKSLQNNLLNQLYVATIEATEEAIINALISAETMVGVDGNTVYSIPHDELKKIFS